MSIPVRSRLKMFFLPIVIGVSCLIPVCVWWLSTGDPSVYFSKHVPPGQTLYVLSKLLALSALSLLWLQCMTALARFSPALRGFTSLTRRQHIVCGTTAAVLMIGHVGTFIAASTLRTQHLALQLLVPRFDSGYFSSYVSIGAIAFWLLVIVVVAGLLRVRGMRGTPLLHRGAFVVIGLAFAHGVAIGSETRFGWMVYVYAFFGLSFAAALLSWLWQRLKNHATTRQQSTARAVSETPSSP